ENGVGKSSVLKAAALVTAGSDALVELVHDVDVWVRTGSGHAAIRAELVTSKNEVREIGLELYRGEGPSQLLRRNQASLEALDSALAHSARNYFVAGVGASRRLTRGDSPNLSGRSSHYRHVRAQSVATLFDSEATLKSLELWAMELDYTRGLDIVSNLLSDLLPGLHFAGIDKQSGQLLFETPDGVISLGQLSEGFQNMCAWVGDLAHRLTTVFDDYHSPFSARGLFLLDELELHLHPRWQRKLIDFLRQRLPNFQILATTHSPLAAQQTQENELYILQREGREVQVSPFEGNASSLLLSQLVTSPAFGLETDASRETEHLRRRYVELRDKKRSLDEDSEFAGLVQDLGSRPEGGRSNLLLSEQQLAFLSKLEDAQRSS
ncbi:MAG: AAA family ATPase, partial [Candidatus Eremiobacteraeota bacterium]|nr:AAA family ATPase [Candidatus Eremiobacteraeota bacterium]